MRDLPGAIAVLGWSATVVTPSYGSLHRVDGAELLATIDVGFRGKTDPVDAWLVPGGDGNVRNIVLDHPLFATQGAGVIYFSDDGDRPFASDANKFALFCAAVAAWVARSDDPPDIVHLHDWHAAMYLLFARFDPQCGALAQIPTVFTIHNLAYQGTRPLRGDESSLEAWFPSLRPDIDAVVDPAHGDCLNPMAAAIRLADRVSTVSETYAREICRPSDPGAGFVGGEGLEHLLADAHDGGRLVGILNGAHYDGPTTRRPGWARLRGLLEAQLNDWRQRSPGGEAHQIALQRIAEWPKRKPLHILTSIGRLVAQKARILLHGNASGATALERIAASLGRNGVIIILGSGEERFEQRLLEVARRCPNVLFLNGYSEVLAEPLYAAGNLFLMPSSFEPCGISQMLAMRAGQPCVVHGVGGLRDTVKHDETGFVFGGNTLGQQADNFVATTLAALGRRTDDPAGWKSLCDRAAAQRFDWALAAERTIRELYGIKDD